MKKIFFLIVFCLLFIYTELLAQSVCANGQLQDVLPETQFERYHFSLIAGNTDTVDVDNAEDFEKAVSKGNVVRVNADIKLQKTITLLSDAIIIGNGHKLIDNGVELINYGNYPWAVTGREAFVNSEGCVMSLSQTGFYQGKWIEPADVNKPSNRLLLPKKLKSMTINESDNVYITYGMWFIRRTDKVKSAKNGIIEIEFTGGTAYQPDKTFRNYTPKPYFYLTNYSNDGIRIANGKVSWSANHGEIRKCQLWNLLKVASGAKVMIDNLSFVGGMDYTIVNEGELNLVNCRFTNSVGGCVVSSGEMSVSNSSFVDVKRKCIYVKKEGIADISYCQFKTIGHYGSNEFAVSGDGKVYVGYCLFEDTNYGAIRVGMVNAETYEDLKEYLIEYNEICYTSSWMATRKYLGLWDSGAIYISTNTQKATVRYNKIRDVGGPGKNIAIYGDDGAYNMDIYCNEISGTQNYYDIDCRYVSPKFSGRKFPDGSGELLVCTNNRIIGNIIDGFVRMEENKNPAVRDARCLFRNNVIVTERKRQGKTLHKDQIYVR